MSIYRVHPAAEAFPMMPGIELQSLAADIQAHGQREPIVVFRGEVLDGRNRLRACQMVNVEPSFARLDAEVHAAGGPVAYVVSCNIRRRHLDESQRAMVAAKLANLRDGQRADRAASIEAPAVSQADAARMLNVGRASVQRAREVLDKGAEPLVRAVERGDVAVSTAATIAKAHTEDEQRQIVAAGERAILDEAKRIREERLPADDFDPGEDDIPDEIANADDEPQVAPEVSAARRWGDFEMSSAVAEVVRESRAFAATIDRIFDGADPARRDEFAVRTESALLELFMKLRGRLPVTSKSVSDNRAGFRAIDGGR